MTQLNEVIDRQSSITECVDALSERMDERKRPPTVAGSNPDREVPQLNLDQILCFLLFTPCQLLQEWQYCYQHRDSLNASNPLHRSERIKAHSTRGLDTYSAHFQMPPLPIRTEASPSQIH